MLPDIAAASHHANQSQSVPRPQNQLLLGRREQRIVARRRRWMLDHRRSQLQVLPHHSFNRRLIEPLGMILRLSEKLSSFSNTSSTSSYSPS